jgi:uncharacterized protein YcbK (DUF882 family)
MRPIARVLALAFAGLVAASAAVYGALSETPDASAATSTGRATAKKPLQNAAESAVSPAFAALPPLRVTFVNTRQSEEIRLYEGTGQVDERAAKRLDTLLGDAHDPKHYETTVLDRRTLQLLYRAAYHLRSYEVVVISAYRKPGRRRQGLHGTGQAIDFKLAGVTAAKLASYLRTLPRVGVGIYTHPRTQYVHLDSRARSFHWIDGSPPGRSWRERSLGGRTIAKTAAFYTRSLDWPVGITPPQVPFEP